MPSDATTNVQLNEFARCMRVPYFRGVFMRNTLPTSGAHRNESGFVNLDNATGPGTHWVAYVKRNNCVYFDSFGNLRPPKELRYFRNDAMTIEYNRTSYQSFCEQMCLRFLQTVDACEFTKLDEMLWNLSISRTLFPSCRWRLRWAGRAPSLRRTTFLP